MLRPSNTGQTKLTPTLKLDKEKPTKKTLKKAMKKMTNKETKKDNDK